MCELYGHPSSADSWDDPQGPFQSKLKPQIEVLLSCLNKETSTVKVVLFSREGSTHARQESCFWMMEERQRKEGWAVIWRTFGFIFSAYLLVLWKKSAIWRINCFDSFRDGLFVWEVHYNYTCMNRYGYMHSISLAWKHLTPVQQESVTYE